MRREPVYTLARSLLVPFLRLFWRWKLIGREKIPREGPVIIAANHISFFDPLCHALLVDSTGRRPRFFAKAELWNKRLVRFVLGNTGQIPVERGTGDTGPVEKAVEALSRGEVTVIYPEATVSHNEDLMPMKGKTGIARVAMISGAPVVPIAVWGSQWVIPKNRVTSRRLWRKIVMKVGDPISFPDRVGMQDDAVARREVTDRIVGELERLVLELQQIHPGGASVPPLKPPKPQAEQSA